MHIPHILLMQEESHDEALSWASTWATNNADWSDWHEVGGRWANEFDDKSSICFAENPVLFHETLTTYQAHVVSELDRYLEEVGDQTLRELCADFGDRFHLAQYHAKQALKISGGDYCYNQQVWDIVDYTKNLDGFYKRIIDKPNEQYLVLVDYHF